MAPVALTIEVLVRRQKIDDALLVDMFRQRHLNQNAVYGCVVVEFGNCLFQCFLRYVIIKLYDFNVYSYRNAFLFVCLYVLKTRRVSAGNNHCKTNGIIPVYFFDTSLVFTHKALRQRFSVQNLSHKSILSLFLFSILCVCSEHTVHKIGGKLRGKLFGKLHRLVDDYAFGRIEIVQLENSHHKHRLVHLEHTVYFKAL